MPEAVDATAAAVQVDAIDHQVQVFFPVVDDVVAQQDLGKAGAVDLDSRVALVLLDGLSAAEHHRPLAGGQQGPAGIVAAGVQRERFGGNPGGDQGGDNAVRSPRFLRTGLQDQSELQRHGGQPQRVHAGRVGRQHGAQHGRLGLIADDHAAIFQAPAPGQNLQRQAAGQAVQDLPHVAEHEGILRDVGAAHVLRQSGAGRLLADEILRRLHAVAHRQRPVFVQVGGLTHTLDQVVAGDLPQDVAGLLGPAHVPLDDTSVGLADPGDRLAGEEMLDLVHFQRLVGLAPAEDRNREHLGVS